MNLHSLERLRRGYPPPEVLRELPGARELLRRHEYKLRLSIALPPPMVQWAEKHRIIIGGARPGPWDPRNAPHAVGPMAAFSDPFVRQVSLASPTQLLKSEFAISAAIYTAIYGHDVLFYEPDEALLKKFMSDRLRPALMQMSMRDVEMAGIDSKFLKKKDSQIELRIGGGGTILGLTPGMASGRSAHTAPVVIIDEIDLMRALDMPLVARSRVTTYALASKILIVSVPSEDHVGTVWAQWRIGSRGIWKGRCPKCREHVRMDWSRVHFERDDEGWWLPQWGDGIENTAAIVCESCGVRWTETMRQDAIQEGRYEHADPRNAHQSFWVPGPAHLWRTVPAIVREGAEAYRGAIEDGNWANYQRFYNEWLGQPWDAEAQGLSAERISTATYDLVDRRDTNRGLLDERVLLVVSGTDVQMDRIETEVIGLGYDLPTRRPLTFGLEYMVVGGGAADSINDPELWDEWERWITGVAWTHPLAPDASVWVQRGLVDSGYMPEIVTQRLMNMYVKEIGVMRYMARKMRKRPQTPTPFGARFLPVRSLSKESGDHPINMRLGVNTKEKRQLPPARVWIETSQIKDMVYESLMRDRRAPEGRERENMWPLDADLRGYGPSYAKQLASEYKQVERTARAEIKTVWIKKFGEAGRNEAWDCRIYATAAAMVELYPTSLPDGLATMLDRQMAGVAGRQT